MVQAARGPRPATAGTSDVGKLVQRLARAIRTRPLYRRPDSGVVADMMGQLKKNFDEVLSRSAFTISVERDTLSHEGRPVFQERNPRDSIPGALLRDGVQSIEFTPGITADEIDAFVMSVAEGLQYEGLGDDILTALWRHGLPHVRLEVHDIISAQDEAAIDALAAGFFSEGNDDVGCPPIPAGRKQIARMTGQVLANIPESASGASAAALETASQTGMKLSKAARSESDEHIEFRLLNASLDMLAQRLPPAATQPVIDALSDAYGAVLRSNGFKRAARFVAAYPQLGRTQGASLIVPLVESAVSPERLREVLIAALPRLDDAEAKEMLVFLKACGSSAIPAILGSYSGMTDPKSRRLLSKIALSVGFDDLGPLRPALMSDQIEVVQEALFILGKVGTPEAQKLLTSAKSHPKAEVRVALLECGAFSDNELMRMTVAFLSDPDPKVQVAAANKLGTFKVGGAFAELKHAVENDLALNSPMEVKDAVLNSFVLLGGAKTIGALDAIIKRGDGRKATDGMVDMAVAAVKVLKSVQSPDTANVLKVAVNSSNKRIRDTATNLVMMLKRGAPRGREE